MRKFWFGVSLVLVFVFAAMSSYIFLVLNDSSPKVDEPYRVAGALGEDNNLVPRVSAEMTVRVRESYACGYEEERVLTGGGEFRGMSFDQLAEEGWAVARVGENQLEIAKEYDEICPLEQEKRLIRQTERGLAVYAGTAEHIGAMLLEMPMNFSELPPNMLAALASGGYQVESPAELDELLESLDELVWSE